MNIEGVSLSFLLLTIPKIWLIMYKIVENVWNIKVLNLLYGNKLFNILWKVLKNTFDNLIIEFLKSNFMRGAA